MTDEELISLTAGRTMWETVALPRLGIPSLTLSDGPHGVRFQPNGSGLTLAPSLPATCFPTASALASTWNPDLVARIGKALGLEARSFGVNVLLGPGINIKRTPLCGRNFEYFSEDPLLTGVLAAAWVRGVQSQGVGSSLKHFAANNQERYRYSVDAIIDEPTLREIYLSAFEHVIKTADPLTVMASYNKLNGTHTSEHHELLTTILRDQWGFQGLVVSDWGAVFDRTPAINAGLDLQMPGFNGSGDNELHEDLTTGRLERASLLRAAANVTKLALTLTQSDNSGYNPDSQAREATFEVGSTSADDTESPPLGPDAEMVAAHHRLARQAAQEAIVLLKNDLSLLPLTQPLRVAVIGELARTPRIQGGGSSKVTPTCQPDFLTTFSRECAPGTTVQFSPGYDPSQPDRDDLLISDARKLAQECDIALVFVGLLELDEIEGVDRQSLKLPSVHEKLIESITEVNPATIVIVTAGTPITMSWHSRVSTIVTTYLGGQAGPEALSDVVTGRCDPGGRLAETYFENLADHPTSLIPATDPQTVLYAEGSFVGYRFADSTALPVLFPFGHGLSYTSFDFTTPELTLSTSTEKPTDSLTLATTVTNVGSRAGSTVLQLYVRSNSPNSASRPLHELRGFTKVHLEPGATQRIAITLSPEAFTSWHSESGSRSIAPGPYTLELGLSSQNLLHHCSVSAHEENGRLKIDLRLDGAEPYRDPVTFDWQERTSRLYTQSKELISGHIADNREDLQRFLDTPLVDLRALPGVAMILDQLQEGLQTLSVQENSDLTLAKLFDAMATEMTPRLLPMITQGLFTPQAIRTLLHSSQGDTTTGWA